MIRHYIVEENLQEDVEKLTRILQENLIINTRNFTSKLDIHKIEKKNCISISISGYKTKENIRFMYQELLSKNVLTFIDIKKSKDFNTVMYDLTLRRGRKYFCRYCLKAICTAEILKSHVDCITVNGKRLIKMP